MNRTEIIHTAMAEGRLSKRLWVYSNYHCNLACRYCLTESSPDVPSRIFSPDEMIAIAHEAEALGFEGIGITGGEPFLLPDIVSTIDRLVDILPVTILTNGTLFHQKRIEELRVLSGRPFTMQISLDHAQPQQNDTMRAQGNFDKVVSVVPKLLDVPLHVRIASTIDTQTEEEQADLLALIQKMGVSEGDHIVRRIVQRGRASLEGLGVEAPIEQLMPELTLTVDGAFWSPFAPTYKNGALQKDLLISTTTQPLHIPVDILLSYMKQVPFDVNADSGFV